VSFITVVNGVAFSPGGRLLASADGDGTVRVWNPATRQPAGALLHAGPQYGVSAVAFSPDGTLLASGDDGLVRLWNPATGQPIGVPSRPAPRPACPRWRSAPTARCWPAPPSGPLMCLSRDPARPYAHTKQTESPLIQHRQRRKDQVGLLVTRICLKQRIGHGHTSHAGCPGRSDPVR
jgi:WD40 repeat protein